MKKTLFDFNKLFSSIKHAYNGLKQALVKEQNFRIEILASFVVIFAGLYFRVSLVEWLWLAVSIVTVLGTELLNTSIERLTDLIVDKRKTSLARQAKDVAAAAVLLTVFQAIICGFCIFGPKIFKLVMG